MITVIHYPTKEPEIHYGVDQKKEDRILKELGKEWDITRSSPEDWPGQDKPAYAVHHWDAKKKRAG